MIGRQYRQLEQVDSIVSRIFELLRTFFRYKNHNIFSNEDQDALCNNLFLWFKTSYPWRIMWLPVGGMSHILWPQYDQGLNLDYKLGRIFRVMQIGSRLWRIKDRADIVILKTVKFLVFRNKLIWTILKFQFSSMIISDYN